MVELQHSKHHPARYGEDGGRFAAAFCHGSDVCFAGALDPDRKKMCGESCDHERQHAIVE